jgi:ribulose kinase
MAHNGTPQELDNMAASYGTQARHLTRAVVAAILVVAEATLRNPSRVIMVQQERSLARVRDQEQKCAEICEDIRDAQEKTEANKAHIEASCTRDATCANAVGVGIMQQMACYEIGL